MGKGDSQFGASQRGRPIKTGEMFPFFPLTGRVLKEKKREGKGRSGMGGKNLIAGKGKIS